GAAPRLCGARLALGFLAEPQALAQSQPAAAAAAPRAAQAASQATKQVRLVAVGNAQTMHTDQSFVDLVVGDPDIADVVPLTNRSFSVQGKKTGVTTLSAYDANRNLVSVMDVEVGANTSRLAAELRRRVPGARIEVASINGRVMLSGTAPDAVALERAMLIARQFSPDAVNALSVSSPQQVMLEVRFVETSRNAGRELGVKWDVVGKRVTSQTGLAGLGNNTPFGVLIGKLLQGGTDADVMIQALEDRGLARRLAEPNLIAMSGQTASFLAGGEFPFPVQGEQGRITVEFKKFGVGLNFTPVVLADRLISLKIEPEVSQIDTTNMLNAGGVAIPSLIVRRASTLIELRDGQSFAIAGLLQSVNVESQKQLPWIGDVPVLGALFRSTAFEKKETELAIIVTPRLVKPAGPGQKLRTPHDNALPANDPQLFLLGKQEVRPEEVRAQALETTRAARGHMLDMTGGAGAR
ncbi:MAG: type II and III secretion system protein family protein, partial [Methylobacteriaceae bacterium]|nr:type II and III secretion system protein family protein [Methylobacteriaceae bacterium]